MTDRLSLAAASLFVTATIMFAIAVSAFVSLPVELAALFGWAVGAMVGMRLDGISAFFGAGGDE